MDSQRPTLDSNSNLIRAISLIVPPKVGQDLQHTCANNRAKQLARMLSAASDVSDFSMNVMREHCDHCPAGNLHY